MSFRIEPLASLAALDQWQPTNRAKVHASSIKLRNRPSTPGPRVLVCHDMANGYNDAFSLGSISKKNSKNYSFQNWALIDDWVYFSHNRITIPPNTWTNAAHSNGVFVYATLITEWDASVQDTLRLLYGPGYDATPIVSVPDNESTPRKPEYPASSFSPYFADKLIQLAEFYGFDGWFINIECGLGSEGELASSHAAAMKEFLQYLTCKLKETIPHGKVLWYDSLTIHGQLRWQDRVNDENKPFFDVCDGIFVNYTWKQDYPRQTAAVVGSRREDVYYGIDVWGRNTFGGGGFNIHKALREITAQGLSTAIFAPAWTYEFLGHELFDAAEKRLWHGEPAGFLNPPFPPQEDDAKPYSTREDPTDLGSVSDYIEIRQSGTRDYFFTDFDRGFGSSYSLAGKVISNENWFNLSRQSPTPSFITSRSIQTFSEIKPKLVPSAAVSRFSRCVSDAESWSGGASLEIKLLPGKTSEKAWTYIPIQRIRVDITPTTVIRFRYKATMLCLSSIGIFFKISAAYGSDTIIVDSAPIVHGEWSLLEANVNSTLNSSNGGKAGAFVTEVGIMIGDDGMTDDSGSIWIGELYVGSNPQQPSQIEMKDYIFTGMDVTRDGWASIGWDSVNGNECERWEVFVDDKWRGCVFGCPVFRENFKSNAVVHVIGIDSLGFVRVEVEGIAMVVV
ncbi:hypothetical protein BCR33DRAFT_767168 [Rhizoclosmatium globosum]|uniref:Cytosolic endo-beta-N-acetylglucosaminidase TIM barrel domain-containing protein n=1 Tax=Rhizoclosmatium globosum TaxID=329046 RepID=A0A1Y2C7L0_9FUNG|nr:hypothetical protein BCR33DRAFT_767168 [Rhizoclosmatium globosum]|eukprot:ORY42295.1 hypothetical protein BCR33DRAFT_767168 [Rhizoclosmatium globosum]